MAFRKMLYPFYKGSQCECNICRSRLKNFEKLENGNLLCPVCGSLPRSRRLYQLLKDEFLKEGFSVLDFSPSRALFRKLKKQKNILYFSTDYEDEFLADYHFDITQIDTENEKFDLILCYHVLEHIEDDASAIKELYRVLKNGGTALIQTPFKEGEIYEDFSIRTEEERTKHFGQKDHVRIYSVNGLKQRLKKNGFTVDVRVFPEDHYYGFAANEKVLVCKK